MAFLKKATNASWPINILFLESIGDDIIGPTALNPDKFLFVESIYFDRWKQEQLQALAPNYNY